MEAKEDLEEPKKDPKKRPSKTGEYIWSNNPHEDRTDGFK